MAEDYYSAFAIWRRAVERVIAAHEARAKLTPYTPEYEAADEEYRAAATAYRVVCTNV